MSRSVLVLNSGSSSVKFQLIDPDSGASLADGIVERIGEDASAASLTLGEMEVTRGDRVADHEAALRTAFELFDEAGAHLDTVGLVAVGHRVVHGGPDLYRPTLVDDALVSKLEELAPLAPLHNPPAVLGIRVALRRCRICRMSRCSTPRSFTTCRPRRRHMRSIETSPSGGTFAVMGFTARRISTSASRWRRFSMCRWPR